MNSVSPDADAGPPTFSVITPTYNRAHVLERSIESSLAFIREAGVGGEIIVIDDASSDGTEARVQQSFGEEIRAGLVRMHVSPRNLGVTGAKQLGSRLAEGEWLLLLDSDDRFLPGVGKKVVGVLQASDNHPIVFFRCINMQTRRLVGPPISGEYLLDLRNFLRSGTPGECIPVLRREALLREPYEAALRGFEGLTYARIIRRYGPAKISPVVIREYCMDPSLNRLSSRKAVLQRACRMAQGYRMLLQEFAREFGFRVPAVVARWWFYRTLCFVQRRTE